MVGNTHGTSVERAASGKLGMTLRVLRLFFAAKFIYPVARLLLVAYEIYNLPPYIFYGRQTNYFIYGLAVIVKLLQRISVLLAYNFFIHFSVLLLLIPSP